MHPASTYESQHIDFFFIACLLNSLLIDQIENRVRWRESVINMINKGIKQFIEIGPGKVLSGLVKRTNRKIKISNLNSLEDINNYKNK